MTKRAGLTKASFRHAALLPGIIAMCCYASASEGVSTTDSLLAKQPLKDYRRIVAFSPAMTEIVYRLGAQERLVGVALFSDYPPEAKEKPTVGGILNIDSEKIISLRPDLIISPPGAIANEKLPTFGADILYLPDKTLADIETAFLRIGQIVGKESEGKALAGALKSAVESARKRNEERPKVKALVVIGYEPMWVAGGYGVVEEMLEAAGGENVAGGEKKDFYAIDFEKVLSQRPEVIVDLTLDAPATDERRNSVKAFWKRFSSIPAAATGRIKFIDSDLLTIPGPRLVEGLAELEKALGRQQGKKAGGDGAR